MATKNTATTIQVSGGLRKELGKRKLFERESYEEVIWDLIEDVKGINRETEKEIEESRKQILKGETVSLSELRERLKK